jgi:hypothetical protein
MNAERRKIRLVDYATVKKVTSEDEPTQEGIKRLRFKPGLFNLAKFLPRCLKVSKQVAINPLAGIKRTSVDVKILT